MRKFQGVAILNVYMKLILTQDVHGTGKKGDIKDVSDGFGRNFLLKNNVAVLATPQALQRLAEEVGRQEKKKKNEEKGDRKIITVLQNREFEMTAKINEDGRLYAAITPKKIAEFIEKQVRLIVPPVAILLDEPIKEIGEHRVDIDLGPGMAATFRLIVSEG